MTTLFTSDHEWLRIEGDVATIGVTDYAQSQLGDVVFVELPKVGRSLKKAEAAAVVESVKAASDVYAPITGEVLEVNEALAAVRLRAYAEGARIDDKLLERLLGESHDWNIHTDYLIRTTRTGLAARLLILAKKAVRPFVRLYTDHLLNRQAQINLYFAHLLHDTIRETSRLQLENQALRHRLEQLEGGPATETGEPSARNGKDRSGTLG